MKRQLYQTMFLQVNESLYRYFVRKTNEKIQYVGVLSRICAKRGN
jgi:hypothetical protein